MPAAAVVPQRVSISKKWFAHGLGKVHTYIPEAMLPDSDSPLSPPRGCSESVSLHSHWR